MRLAALVLVLLVGCGFPDDETALEANRKIQESRDQLHELGGEARGYYAASTLMCMQVAGAPVAGEVCSKIEPAYDIFSRAYRAAAASLNAAQSGLMAYPIAKATVDALDEALDGVHELMAEVSNAVASGTGPASRRNDSGGNPEAGGLGRPAEADPDQGGVGAQPAGSHAPEVDAPASGEAGPK